MTDTRESRKMTVDLDFVMEQAALIDPDLTIKELALRIGRIAYATRASDRPDLIASESRQDAKAVHSVWGVLEGHADSSLGLRYCALGALVALHSTGGQS